MIFGASWLLSARLYRLFQAFAPSNIAIRRVHTRDSIKWGSVVGLGGVLVYGFAMLLAVGFVQDAGPGWVNLIVAVAFWNTVKFATLIPVSLVRLLGVRHQERSCSAPTSAPLLPTPYRPM